MSGLSLGVAVNIAAFVIQAYKQQNIEITTKYMLLKTITTLKREKIEVKTYSTENRLPRIYVFSASKYCTAGGYCARLALQKCS